MFRRIAILVLVVMMLFSFAGCGLKKELRNQTETFYENVNGTIPRDMHLTIFYLNYHSLRHMPYNVQMLMGIPDLTIISVSYEDLVKHQDYLKKFDPESLIPRSDDAYMDIELYCLFESESSGTILEFVHSAYGGSDYINGIPIETNSELLELIYVFLPDDCIHKVYDPLA